MKVSSIGIDIGETSVKVVKVERSLLTAKTHLIALEEFPLERRSDLPAVLALVLKKEPFLTGKINLNFPVEECYFLKLTLPFSSHKKINQTINYEIESRVPFSLKDFSLDYQVLPASDGTSEIIIAMVPTSTAGMYARLLSMSDRDGKFVDLSGLSSAKLSNDSNKSPCVFLYLGISSLTMFFFSEGLLKEIRSFTIAEKEDLFVQIKTAIDLFSIKHLTHGPIHVYIGGDGLNQITVSELTKNLELQPIVPDLCQSLTIDVNPKVAARWKPEIFNEALAVAFRGLSSSPPGFCLVPPQRGLLGLKNFISRRKNVAWAVASVLFLLITEGILELTITQAKIKRIDREMIKTYRELVSDSESIRDPLKEIKTKLQGKTKSSTLKEFMAFPSFMEIMAEVSRLVPLEWEFKIETTEYQPPGLTIRGAVKDSTAAKNIEQILSKSPQVEEAKLEILQDVEKTGRIPVILKLKLRAYR